MSEITFDQVSQGGNSAPEAKENFFDKYSSGEFDGEGSDQGQDGDPDESAETQTGDQENPETEEAEATDGNEEATTPEVSFKGVKPNVVAKMKQYAAANGYELSDPKTFKLLRMISEQQIQIENGKLAAPSPKADGYLAELESKFADPTPAPEEKPDAGQNVEEPEFVRLFKTFKNDEDWFANHEDAWAKVGDAKTPEERRAAIAAINNSHMAFMENAFMNRYAPMLMQFIEREFGQRLKPVMEEASSRERQSLQQNVMSELGRLPQFEGIEKILEKTSEDPFIYDGQEWDDTPLNRVVALNPSIRQIKGKNPRHTLALQMSKIFELSKGLRTTKPKPDAVTAAMRAGEKIAESKRKNPIARHSLSGGNTGLAAEPKKSRVSDLWTPSDSGPSFNDLFK